MSNQVGDRYSCSDPECGCEVEIARPCSMSSSEDDVAETGSTPRRRDFRSEPTSTTGDYGSQGATGEGVFGGAGTGDRSATASGRYDTESTMREDAELNDAEASESEVSGYLICFCGNEMRKVGSGKQRAQGAGSSGR